MNKDLNSSKIRDKVKKYLDICMDSIWWISVICFAFVSIYQLISIFDADGTELPHSSSKTNMINTKYMSEESCEKGMSSGEVGEYYNQVVYISPSGKKCHLKSSCAGKNAIETTLGQTTNPPCRKCARKIIEKYIT